MYILLLFIFIWEFTVSRTFQIGTLLSNALLKQRGVFAWTSVHISHLKTIALVDGLWFLTNLPIIIGRFHYIFYEKLWIEFVLGLHVNYFNINEFQGVACGIVVKDFVVFLVS